MFKTLSNLIRLKHERLYHLINSSFFLGGSVIHLSHTPFSPPSHLPFPMAANMERLHIGRSVYYRVHDEKHGYWVLSGKGLADVSCVWRVKWDRESGREFFVNAGDRRKVWRLPDVQEAAQPQQPPQQQQQHPASRTPPFPTATPPLFPIPPHQITSPGEKAFIKRQQRPLQTHSDPYRRTTAVTHKDSTTTHDPEKTEMKGTIAYLWEELKKSAVEVDETRRIAAETQTHCDNLQAGMEGVSRDLECALREITELRRERDLGAAAVLAVQAQRERSQDLPLLPSVAHTPLVHAMPAPVVAAPLQVTKPLKALLVGLSYCQLTENFLAVDEIGKPVLGVFARQQGVHGDVKRFQAYLGACGFSPPAALCLLTDDNPDLSLHPTRANVLAAFEWLVTNAQQGDHIVVQLKALSTYMESERETVLLPADCGTSGILRGDSILSVLSRLPFGVHLVIVSDVQGSVFDLSNTYSINEAGIAAWEPPTRGFALSADVVIINEKTKYLPGGANGSPGGGDGVTSRLLEALERHPGGSFKDIIEGMWSIIRETGGSAVPEISSNRRFDELSPFLPFAPSQVRDIHGATVPAVPVAPVMPVAAAVQQAVPEMLAPVIPVVPIVPMVSAPAADPAPILPTLMKTATPSLSASLRQQVSEPLREPEAERDVPLAVPTFKPLLRYEGFLVFQKNKKNLQRRHLLPAAPIKRCAEPSQGFRCGMPLPCSFNALWQCTFLRRLSMMYHLLYLFCR